MSESSIAAWLDSAPSALKSWFRTTSMYRFVCDSQRQAFNAPGRYDGAMSDECKTLIRDEYRTLTEIRNWMEKPSA